MISLKPPHLSSAEESCMGNESEPEPEAKNTDSSTDPTKDEGNETYDDDDGGFDELAYEEALARYVGEFVFNFFRAIVDLIHLKPLK